MPVRPRSTQCSPPHAHDLDRLAPGAHALGRRARQAGADPLDHLIDGEAMGEHRCFPCSLGGRSRRAARARGRGVPSQNFIRSRNLGHYRPKCGPKQDRNFNSLLGRENSLFFAENSLFTPKNFPACSTRRSNFVTAWLYQSSRAIGISHIRHDQAIGPDVTRQRIDGLNAVHVYLSKHKPALGNLTEDLRAPPFGFRVSQPNASVHA